jgi:uncharacterized protein (TIGR03086 family)
VEALSILDQTNALAAAVLSRIGSDDLDRPTPCAGWDLKTCVNKLVTSTRFCEIAVSKQRRASELDVTHPPDMIGDNPNDAFRDAADAFRVAITEPAALERLVPSPVPGLDLTGEQMLSIRIFDTTVITWDLARSIGADPEIDEIQAAYALEVAQVVIPRCFGYTDHQRFQPAWQPAPADTLGRLIAATGRDPNWRPNG